MFLSQAARITGSADGYGKSAHPFRPNFKWLEGALIPLTKGDLVIPDCHNRTQRDGVNHLFSQAVGIDLLIGMPVHGLLKKPVKIGTEECCLKNG